MAQFKGGKQLCRSAGIWHKCRHFPVISEFTSCQNTVPIRKLSFWWFACQVPTSCFELVISRKPLQSLPLQSLKHRFLNSVGIQTKKKYSVKTCLVFFLALLLFFLLLCINIIIKYQSLRLTSTLQEVNLYLKCQSTNCRANATETLPITHYKAPSFLCS